MKEIEFQAGERIFNEGDPSAHCYQVLSGKVEIRLGRKGVASAGRDVPIEVLGPGDVFGEMSIIDEGPRSASAVATEPTRCAVYAADQVLDMLRNDPEEAFELIVTLVQRLRKANKKLVQMARTVR